MFNRYFGGLLSLAVAIVTALYFEIKYYDFIVVFILGMLFSAIELGSRYKDEPFRVISSIPGFVYLFVNGSICIFGLYLIRVFNLSVKVDELLHYHAQITSDILQASLLSFFIMRSSFLQLGKEQSQVDLGLNQLLKKLIDILDRQVDRTRAKDRSSDITSILKDVSNDDVYKKRLPFCLAVMQNVSVEESGEIFREAAKIDSSDDDDVSKKHAMGLLIYNVVGRNVFASAVLDLELKDKANAKPDGDGDEGFDEVLAIAVNPMNINSDTKTD